MDLRGSFPSNVMDKMIVKVITDMATSQRKEILKHMEAEQFSPMPSRKVVS